jgi:hypothetical protein
MKGENDLERAEYHLNSVAALRPFAAFLLQYVKDGGDVLDPRNAPKEMHEMLELLRPLTESMSREELQLLLEKASSGKFEDELLMCMATDGEDEEQGEAPRDVVVDDNSFGEDPDVYENVSVRPGFVVKTRTNTGRKVMVNVCGAKEVPKPERWSARTITEGEATEMTLPRSPHSPLQQPREKLLEEEKKAKDEDEEYIVNNLEKTHRFPLACSDVRGDIDRNGNACDVYDVTFNDEVVEVAAKAMFEPLTMTTTSEYNATTTDATTRTTTTVAATREAKLRDSLATICVEVVSKKRMERGTGGALDPKFTLPKRTFAGSSPPPPMRVKKFLSTSSRRSQLRQEHMRRKIVEVNTPMSPLSTTRRPNERRLEQTRSSEDEEEEGGFAFRLSPERKRSAIRKRKQSQTKNVATIANAAAAAVTATMIPMKKKPRVKIDTSYPDRPLTTFATVTLTFDSEQSLGRAKLNVSGRESMLCVSFDDDDDHHNEREGEEGKQEEDLLRGIGCTEAVSTQYRTEFPFFIDVKNIRAIETEELTGGEMGDSGSDTAWRDPLTVTLKIPFILTSTLDDRR